MKFEDFRDCPLVEKFNDGASPCVWEFRIDAHCKMWFARVMYSDALEGGVSLQYGPRRATDDTLEEYRDYYG